MKRLTTDNFSTAFQLIIIALLFIYAAFPGKSIIGEKAAADSTGTVKEVKQKLTNGVYIINPPRPVESNKMLTWVIPDIKNSIITHTAVSGNQSAIVLKANSK